ncbi:MAG TPA: hypothetical protein VLU73_02400 [Methylococcaceae bacterium]|jgi:hypothetical protein|nr:hypothetical protein [Methylococcaceae bacterium]
MKLTASVALATVTFFLAGCAVWHKEETRAPPPVPPNARYSGEDADALLRFGGEFAALTPDRRLAECKELLQLNLPVQSLGLRLHLFLAQLLTESCGDIRETSGTLKARQSEIKDERVRHFLTFQEAMRARLEGEIEQKKSLDLNLKFTQQQARKRKRELITFESEAKNCESDLSSCESDLVLRESELKALKDKLDALKSIEQNLGGSKGH